MPSHETFTAFWEAGGPWPPLALSVLVGVVALTVGALLIYHGTSMSSSPLILCSVTGLLIGLAMTVVLPQVCAPSRFAPHAPPVAYTTHMRGAARQALERLMTVMPSERIFVVFLVAPLLMFIWEHVVRPARRGPLLASPCQCSPPPGQLAPPIGWKRYSLFSTFII